MCSCLLIFSRGERRGSRWMLLLAVEEDQANPMVVGDSVAEAVAGELLRRLEGVHEVFDKMFVHNFNYRDEKCVETKI